jgi:hypothetical protein
MTQLVSLVLIEMLASWGLPTGSVGSPVEGGVDGAVIAAPDDEQPPAAKPPAPAPKPPAQPPPKAPAKKKDGVACKLLTEEAPRGGQIDIQGVRFGQTPLVRIGERVARMISRTKNQLSVQVHRDSDGGPVTVQVGKTRAVCGWLTIIGKD